MSFTSTPVATATAPTGFTLTTDTQIPHTTCPTCGGAMLVKTNRQTHSTGYGNKFASCANFPKCVHARPLTENDLRAITQARAAFEKELQEQDW